MNARKEIVSGYYDQYDEDGRLLRTRHGQLEYCTTMTYIHRYAAKGSRVLEVGAGTGRYSIALAKEGKDVTAVELAESNLAVLKKNSRGMKNIASYLAFSEKRELLGNTNHLLYICRKRS